MIVPLLALVKSSSRYPPSSSSNRLPFVCQVCRRGAFASRLHLLVSSIERKKSLGNISQLLVMFHKQFPAERGRADGEARKTVPQKEQPIAVIKPNSMYENGSSVIESYLPA